MEKVLLFIQRRYWAITVYFDTCASFPPFFFAVSGTLFGPAKEKKPRVQMESANEEENHQ